MDATAPQGPREEEVDEGEHTKKENSMKTIENIEFDYSALASSDRKVIRAATDRINRRLKKTMADMVAIGEDLIAVKDRLDHGQFRQWIISEFGWSKSTASNYMRIHDAFSNVQNLDICPSAAITLSAESVSDEAFAEAIERAESGETITHATAQEIIESHRESSDPPELDCMSAFRLVRESIVKICSRLPDKAKPAIPEFLRTLANQIERGEQ